MKDAPIFYWVRLAVPLLLLVSSCTYYVPAKLETNRVGDTLRLALTGPGAARWEATRDSLVIECPACEPTRDAEYFADANEADYEIPASESLTLLFYSMGTLDTLSLPGTAVGTGNLPRPHLMPRRYRPSAAPIPPKTPVEAKAEKEKAAERALQTTTLLKVTAPEGVAIYTDKTKRQVIKILPQGSTLVLLAKEGDLYSVSIDGQEGFVDSEAVQIQK